MSSDLTTVLLVEDNPDDADLIEHAFRKAKIANPLTVVDDGEKAVAWLAAEAPYADRGPLPALALLDLKLPRRSGFEVLQWARANEATRRLPIVILTSSDQTPDIRRAYDLGANSYLVKPVGSDALLDMVRALNQYWIVLNRVG